MEELPLLLGVNGLLQRIRLQRADLHVPKLLRAIVNTSVLRYIYTERKRTRKRHRFHMAC